MQKYCQKFCKNKCQQPHADNYYDWKVSVLDKTIQKNSIFDEELLTWGKKKSRQNNGVPWTPCCSWRHTVQPWSWSLMCSSWAQNHTARVFWSTVNYIHCITLTPFFRELTDDKMCSYFIQDSVTVHTANFSMTIHVYVNIPHSLWEMKEYIKKKLPLSEDEHHCHVTTHLQKVRALLRSWRSVL